MEIQLPAAIRRRTYSTMPSMSHLMPPCLMGRRCFKRYSISYISSSSYSCCFFLQSFLFGRTLCGFRLCCGQCLHFYLGSRRTYSISHSLTVIIYLSFTHSCSFTHSLTNSRYFTHSHFLNHSHLSAYLFSFSFTNTLSFIHFVTLWLIFVYLSYSLIILILVYSLIYLYSFSFAQFHIYTQSITSINQSLTIVFKLLFLSVLLNINIYSFLFYSIFKTHCLLTFENISKYHF